QDWRRERSQPGGRGSNCAAPWGCRGGSSGIARSLLDREGCGVCCAYAGGGGYVGRVAGLCAVGTGGGSGSQANKCGGRNPGESDREGAEEDAEGTAEWIAVI